MNTSEAVAGLAERLRAGLEGVTPGPWVWGMRYICQRPAENGYRFLAQTPEAETAAEGSQWERNAAHIALCSPDNILLLLDALAARDARIAELVAELEAEKARSDMMRVQRDGHAAEAERTRADEREACAKIAAAGVYYRVGQGKCFAPGSREIAAAILARAALPSAPTEETSHEG